MGVLAGVAAIVGLRIMGVYVGYDGRYSGGFAHLSCFSWSLWWMGHLLGALFWRLLSDEFANGEEDGDNGLLYVGW